MGLIKEINIDKSLSDLFSHRKNLEEMTEKTIIEYEKNINHAINSSTKKKLMEILYYSTLLNQETLFDKNLIGIANIAKKPEEIIEIMKLRYNVYKELGYNKEFNTEIPGLDFDRFDKNSIFVIYSRNNEITATTRIIKDTVEGLLSEKKYDLKTGFNEIRIENWLEHKKIAELSRTVIKPEYQKSGIEFRSMFSDLYNIGKSTDIGNYLMVMPKDMYHALYEKCGMEIIKEIENYGNIDKQSVIIKWDINNINPFFKRIILKEKSNKLSKVA